GALGTHNTLGLAKDKRASFILASTSEVYGDPLEHPQKEDYWGNVNPIGPRGVYDEAKRFAEAITMAYHRYHRVDTKIVRIFNTYGPRMRLRDGRVVPAFIGQALNGQPLTVFGDGSQTRSFCYVSDLIDGIFKLAMSNFHEPVNLGNPREMTIKQFADEIIRITGTQSAIGYKPLPVDDPKVRQPDRSEEHTSELQSPDHLVCRPRLTTLFPYTTLFRSCYVSDLIDGIFKLAMSNFHEPVNLGNPREMTIKQFADEIIRITGTQSAIGYKPLPVDDPKVRQPDRSEERRVGQEWK